MPEPKDCDRPCWGPRLDLTHVWRTCNKIRAAIFRGGLNLWDYFTPLDPKKNTLISESQFVSVLAGPLKDVIGVSGNEIAQLTDYFRVPDGRIFYTQFCQVIHDSVPNLCQNPPIVSGLEWNDPMQVNSLSPAEECRLQVLLVKIATLANMRRLVLRPYFQDYELIAKNEGTVTIAHFARVLDYLGIMLSPDDFHLLIKKFVKDSYTVNYVAFVVALDNIFCTLDQQTMLDFGGDVLRQFPGRALCAELPKLPRPEVGGHVRTDSVFGTPNVFHPVLMPPPRPMSVMEVLRRFQAYLLGSRVRCGEFFRDFDQLRTGRVSESQFRRCLDMLGATGIQRFYLTEAEVERLVHVYRDPNDKSRICYLTFEDDMDQVFTVKELEKCPELRLCVPPPEVTEMPCKGASHWHEVGEVVRDICETAVLKVKQRVEKRRIDLKPLFSDFDRRNKGRVGRAQFRQVLISQGILLTTPEMDALETRYLDDGGFNYLWFLREMLGGGDEEPLFNSFVEKLKKLNGPRRLPLPWPSLKERDIVEILAKIKGKVVREGIRVMEFLQPYDQHNEENISRDHFCRALSVCRFGLTPCEMDTLMDVFGTPLRPGRVDYRRFSETVEEALTQRCLERAPLIVPLQHVPTRDGCCNFLNFEERQLASLALKKLAEKPFMNLEEVFKDFDRCNVGLVTPEQFLNTLTLRNLNILLTTPELSALLRCFGVRRGLHDDVDWRAFCKALEILYINNRRRVF